MRIEELIQQLEDIRDAYGNEVEIRLGMQPNYPFEYSIKDRIVCSREDSYEEYEKDGNPVIWLLEGTQLGYFTKDVWY